MKKRNLRAAFSMITAIFVIMIMATVGIFVMSLSGKIVKSTTAQYQHEQAELYAKSYTEYAVLAVTGNDRSVECIEDINANIGDDVDEGNGYRIRTRIAYIINGTQVDTSKCAGTRVWFNGNLVTELTPMSVVIDAYVDYKDPDNPSGPWLTVHRRSVQKI